MPSHRRAPLTGRGAGRLLRIPRYAAIAALVIGAGAAAAGCTTPTTPSSSAPPARSAPAQTATAWWNSAGQGFFEASNQDLTAVNNDSVNNPSAVPADDQQLISDAQTALANPPPADPADYNAYYNDVFQLADNPGPMTGEDAAINNDGAQHLQSFQDALACYVPSAGGTCPTWGSSGGSAPVPSQSSPGPGSGSGSAGTRAPVTRASADTPAAAAPADTPTTPPPPRRPVFGCYVNDNQPGGDATYGASINIVSGGDGYSSAVVKVVFLDKNGRPLGTQTVTAYSSTENWQAIIYPEGGPQSLATEASCTATVESAS